MTVLIEADAPPCSLCRTTGGFAEKGRAVPARFSGAVFERPDGRYCKRCYRKLLDRFRRAHGAPGPKTKKARNAGLTPGQLRAGIEARTAAVMAESLAATRDPKAARTVRLDRVTDAAFADLLRSGRLGAMFARGRVTA